MWHDFNGCKWMNTKRLKYSQNMSILLGLWFGLESTAKTCPFCRGADFDVNRQPKHVLFAGVLISTWFDSYVKLPRHERYKDTRKYTYFNSSRWFTWSRKMRWDQVHKYSVFVRQADLSLDQSTLGNFMTGLRDFWLIQILNSNVHLNETFVKEINIYRH